MGSSEQRVDVLETLRVVHTEGLIRTRRVFDPVLLHQDQVFVHAVKRGSCSTVFAHVREGVSEFRMGRACKIVCESEGEFVICTASGLRKNALFAARVMDALQAHAGEPLDVSYSVMNSVAAMRFPFRLDLCGFVDAYNEPWRESFLKPAPGIPRAITFLEEPSLYVETFQDGRVKIRGLAVHPAPTNLRDYVACMMHFALPAQER